MIKIQNKTSIDSCLIGKYGEEVIFNHAIKLLSEHLVKTNLLTIEKFKKESKDWLEPHETEIVVSGLFMPQSEFDEILKLFKAYQESHSLYKDQIVKQMYDLIIKQGEQELDTSDVIKRDFVYNDKVKYKGVKCYFKNIKGDKILIANEEKVYHPFYKEIWVDKDHVC